MVIRTIEFHRAAYQPADFPRDKRPQFAVVGRSNVGKSSLINAVLGRKKVARVSQTPGKTQAIQFYLINEKFHIVDLPGYGFAKVSRSTRAEWGKLIESYFDQSDSLKLIFLLLDSRRVPSDEDLALIEWMESRGIEYRLVLTKVDKLSKNELAKSRKAIADTTGADTASFIAFSVMTKQGVGEFWREVTAQLGEGKQEQRPDQG